MKKLSVCAVLALAMIMLSSCGAGNAAPQVPAADAGARQASENHENSDGAKTDAAEKSEAEGEIGQNAPGRAEEYNVFIERPVVDFTLEKQGGDAITVLETFYETLSVPDAPEAAQKQIDAWNGERARAMRDDILDIGQYIYNSFQYDRGIFPWRMKYALTVDRADSAFISFCETGDSYCGGVNENIDYTSHTLDVQSGKELVIDDIVTDGAALAEAIEEQMKRDEVFSDVIKYCRDDTDMTFAEYLMEYYIIKEYGFSLPWTLTGDGLRIWLSDYMLGGYSFGARDIVLPYEEHKELFRDGVFLGSRDADKGMETLVTQKEISKKERSLYDYCWNEGDFMLVDYTELAGIYISEEGDVFEIYEDGDYNDVPGAGEATGGFLRGNPGGFSMYRYPAGYAAEVKTEDLCCGSVMLMDRG